MHINSIAILGHEFGYSPANQRYIISHLCRYWLQKGIDVKILKGIKRDVDADIILNHIDTTVTPDKYIDFMKKYKYRINSNVRNISKKLYSNNMLTQGDAYKGKVFLKTDANCGGEIDYFIRQVEKHGKPAINRTRQRNWSSKLFMNSYNYRLYENIDAVPEDAWKNDKLIVEKFLPEIVENNNYQVRYWYFFGNKEFNIGVQSDKPVVKGPNITKRYFIDHIPDELRDYRSRFGFDYGRFDYSIVDGEVNLFDMNRTPTIGKSMQELLGERFPAELADGLTSIIT
ncbi:MAG TPA: hypothetical protein VJ981_02260 [Gammaproteobacteria bacterium]|nr:hypothetical protein [Gammaproteobacteria bacterium]